MKKLTLLIIALFLCSGAFAFTAEHESNQTSPASINITGNITYDNITLVVPGPDLMCENCSGINGTLDLDAGTYVLQLAAQLGNETTYENFTLHIYEMTNSTNVTNTTNVTNINITNVKGNSTRKGPKNETRNETNGSRFANDFEKLPQMVEAGNISDAELAAILNANQLNPGIINRLVKTGKLGNESLDAIIEKQKTPPGIFAKIGRALGFNVKTAKDRILDYYNLTPEQEAQLSADPDVSKKTGEHLKEDVMKKAPGLLKKEAGERGKPDVVPGKPESPDKPERTAKEVKPVRGNETNETQKPRNTTGKPPKPSKP